MTPTVVNRAALRAEHKTFPGAGRHFVYHLCAPDPSDPEAVVHLYVGVTSNLRQRLRQHSRKAWWPLVDLDSSEFIEHPDRESADEDEVLLIGWYQPVVNRRGVY